MSVWLPRRTPIPSRQYSQVYWYAACRSGSSRSLHLRLQPANSAASSLQLHSLLRRQDTVPLRVATVQQTRLQTTDASTDPKPSPPTPKDVTEKPPLATRVWAKVKHEAQHYWHGSKLLVSEVRISARLQWKILHGETLTRRERRQVSPCTFLSAWGIV